jgi:phytoene dehydrogenase-like protein
MNQNGRKIAIVGGGIAGLCAAVYAQECGYQAEVLEMHEMAGGLATSWHRGQYTFETCMHWLWGSNPHGPMHSQWLEVCDLDRLNFVTWDKFAHIENENGESLDVYSNVDRLERELLKRAPQDSKEIRRLCAAVRSLGKFRMPDPGGSRLARAGTMLGNAPRLPLLRELMRVSAKGYGKRFKDPLVRSFFGEGDVGEISALAVIFSLAWMNQGDAGYPIGGSQALIRLIEERFRSLGGRIRLGAKVDRILVDHGAAVGVRLVTGETIPADWVVSAADGHATIYELLEGKFTDRAIDKLYAERATFPSYLQVSLGVARDLSALPAQVTRVLDAPFEVDPGTELKQVSFRFFNFDPTFAAAGKTAVTCFLPTRNYEYWVHLHQTDPNDYRKEKERVAQFIVSTLEKKIPDVRPAIEVIDVSTPFTVIRYTGNWKGSMEGWFVAPGSGFRLLPNTLPGLRKFMMVGQWVMPGGGLPSGPMTARPAIQAICKHDRVPFTPGLPVAGKDFAPPAMHLPGPRGAH